MAKAKGPSCRSATSAGPGLKWECSLPTGHKGMHAAKGVSGMVLHRWKRRITTRRTAQPPETSTASAR
ncbi:hypothetical protein [Mycobacteroides abscessus]|uniref:hypothetical protein n=1 Tax=Mycobacteroides abscessus TaxID=36809 RepID=UPI00092C2AC2|nr:hypothetical protein [Mycobacteroides abscessus]SHQ49739.1 Uncharacterised protein [Mycobacteroides abscessus subsp. abscessus]SKQ84163.1 Uncharacterised protein [Mycobacteroides abscessus subsp. massiliense]SLC49535.1 Uncharacterised protein [Mycobacteroides abscessus subsp. massiliense]